MDIFVVVWKIGGVYIKFLGGNMFFIGRRENFFIVVINIDDRFLIFFLFYF